MTLRSVLAGVLQLSLVDRSIEMQSLPLLAHVSLVGKDSNQLHQVKISHDSLRNAGLHAELVARRLAALVANSWYYYTASEFCLQLRTRLKALTSVTLQDSLTRDCNAKRTHEFDWRW